MEFIILLWIIWPIMAGSIAHSKNRFWPGWVIMGILTGFIGVIWVAALPSLDNS